MATTNQLVTKAKFILSRSNSTAFDATIINELGLAQERLEREKWLPQFLYANQTISVTSDDVDLGVVVTRFNRFHREAGGLTYQTNDPGATEPFVKLTRYEDREQLLQAFPGPLGAGGHVQGYFMVDQLLTLRPYPSVAVPQSLKLHFFQSEVALPAVGNSTIWTQKASDYLLGEAGMIIAQGLRDDKAFALFQQMRQTDKMRIYGRDVADDEQDLDRSMGSD